MADNSLIEWTDATWNPITGCAIVSPGCTNCYAMKLAGTRLRNIPSRMGLTDQTKAGPVWNGQVRFNREWLDQPLRWKRPRRIFVCAHGDLFAEKVPDEWIDQVFAVMALSPQHTFQVLTKRAERMRDYLWRDRFKMGSETLGSYECIYNAMGALEREGIVEAHPYRRVFPNGMPWPLPNVWLGVSTERQQEADARIPLLLQTPAAIRFISAEPLLGPIDLQFGVHHHPDNDPGNEHVQALVRAARRQFDATPSLDWVIVGGESGTGARSMHPDWARSLRDQCRDAGVPFFFKQWGEWAPSSPEQAANNPRSGWKARAAYPHVAKASELYPDQGAAFVEFMGKKRAGHHLDGVEHHQFPTGRTADVL